MAKYFEIYTTQILNTNGCHSLLVLYIDSVRIICHIDFKNLFYYDVQVSQYLRSKKWDTRVAAAHAIGSIADNVKHISLNELIASVVTKMSESGISCSVDDLCAWPYLQAKITGSSFRRLFNQYNC